MKLVTFRRGNRPPEPGIVLGERIVSLVGAGYADVMSLVALGDEAGARVEDWTHSASEDQVTDLASVRLLAPVPRPNKLICVGLNYRDHAIESKMDIPKVPTIFNKFATSVIGPGDNIVLP